MTPAGWLERASNLGAALRRRSTDDARTRWSRDELHAYQRAQLSELVKHAAERSPFSRAVWRRDTRRCRAGAATGRDQERDDGFVRSLRDRSQASLEVYVVLAGAAPSDVAQRLAAALRRALAARGAEAAITVSPVPCIAREAGPGKLKLVRSSVASRRSS